MKIATRSSLIDNLALVAATAAVIAALVGCQSTTDDGGGDGGDGGDGGSDGDGGDGGDGGSSQGGASEDGGEGGDDGNDGEGGAAQSGSGGSAGSGGASNGGQGGSGSGGSGQGGAAMGGSGGGSPGGMGGANMGGAGGGAMGMGGALNLPKFSFFVTSLAAMRQVSGSQNGFGGDLRFGEATGVAGADKICKTIAEMGMPGAGQKVWRAFISASAGGPNNGPIHAIERVGTGPWYDRNGRLLAMNVQGLLSGPRPAGDAQLVADLTNEKGEPNKMGTDNHDTITGSNKMGRYPGGAMTQTCNDWTTTVGNTGRPMIGHSWPRNPNSLQNGGNWMSDHPAPGCGAGVNLMQNGGGDGTPIIGGGGGYGGLYCFATTP